MTTEIGDTVHPASSEAWEDRERLNNDIAVSRALAVLPPELQRRIADPKSVVSPLVVAEQAKAMEEAFQALCAAVLTDDDYAYYVVKKQRVVTNPRNGFRSLENVDVVERRKRKSAWRKVSRFFNLDVDVVREVIGHRHDPETCSRIVLSKFGLSLKDEEDCACETIYARYHIKVIAANGRIGFGVGIASARERGFKSQDHSIPATAYTRALSRAESDLLGAGEGEADDPAETHDAADAEPRREPATSHAAAPTELDAVQVRQYEGLWKSAPQDRRDAVAALLKREGYGPGEFRRRGAEHFDEVVAMLEGREVLP